MKTFTFAAALLVPAMFLAADTRFTPLSADAAETARIRAHLAQVEQELRRTDISAWSPAQRLARARHLDVLHAYWVRGVFPKNTDFPGERVAYFIDRVGTRCAMAQLIEQSGHGAFVARVAATNNNARVRQLEHDPELVAWLEENGLTAAEAARIQPQYCGEPGAVGCIDAPSKERAAVAASLSAGTTLWGLAGTSSAWLAPVGIGSGLFGLISGTVHLTETGGERTLGVVSAGFGATALYLGIRSLVTGGAEPPAPAPVPVASLVPWTGPQGSGLALRIRF